MVGAAIVLAMLAVANTYRVFNHTMDEQFHIAAGLEWLQRGNYTLEYQHPPIARIVLGIGPYLAGLRLSNPFLMWEDSYGLLYQQDYWTVLSLARAGNLVFLSLATWFVYLWGRRWFDNSHGVIAALVFLAVPPILGHAGLATLDLGCAAMLLCALYCLLRWREEAGSKWLIWSSITCTLAILTKFSNLVFLGASVLVGLIYFLEPLRKAWASGGGARRQALGRAGLFVLLSLIVGWGVYRFHLGSLNDHIAASQPEFKKAWAERIQGMKPERRQVVETAAAIKLPFLEVLHGIREVYEHNRKGHQTYLMGVFSMKGAWYFFPLVILIKTPPAILLLLALGLLLVLAKWSACTWPQRLTLLIPVAMLATCMISSINIGIRHCLVLFPFFALLASHGICRIAERWKLPPQRILVQAILLVVVFSSTVLAYPDQLAYFNFIAGAEPEKIVVESDLDWGQDLARLSQRLAEKKIASVKLAYFGSALPDHHGLPQFELADPNHKQSGWIAISAQKLYLSFAKDGSYGWLKQYQPVERVGKSIFLFYIEP